MIKKQWHGIYPLFIKDTGYYWQQDISAVQTKKSAAAELSLNIVMGILQNI